MEASLDPDLRRLLALRHDQLTNGGTADLGNLAHFIVVEPGDLLAAAEAEAGFPIAHDPPFEWVQRHPGGWLEAAVILSDDGFAVALLVPDDSTTDPALLLALLAHA